MENNKRNLEVERKVLEEIYYKNENGKGFRSIGEWIIIKTLTDFDPSHYNFNEHQMNHLKKVIEKYECAVIMKESYAEKYRIHDLFSFMSWFLANIYGELVYKKYDEIDEKIKEIYISINILLTKISYIPSILD